MIKHEQSYASALGALTIEMAGQRIAASAEKAMHPQTGETHRKLAQSPKSHFMVTLAAGVDVDSQKPMLARVQELKQTDLMKLNDKSDSSSTFGQIGRMREPGRYNAPNCSLGCQPKQNQCRGKTMPQRGRS
jgi:hypothetical protein